MAAPHKRQWDVIRLSRLSRTTQFSEERQEWSDRIDPCPESAHATRDEHDIRDLPQHRFEPLF